MSTANTFVYLNQNPECKKKLLAEVIPALEEVKDDFQQKFTQDIAMDFTYLQ
jgi:hypothetical protein